MGLNPDDSYYTRHRPMLQALGTARCKVRDMDERKLYRADLAELAGVKVDTLNGYKLPPRDGTDIDAGKARPWWWESTAREWMANRPGRGARTDLRPEVNRTAMSDE